MKIVNKYSLKNPVYLWLKLLILLVLIAGITAFFAFGWNRLLTLDTIQANRDRLLEYSKEHYWDYFA